MKQFLMSESGKERFLSGDEGRGDVRKEAAATYPGESEIQIVDEDGNLFDTISGAESQEDETDDRAVIVSEEELQEKSLSDALLAADLARVESEIKPLIFAKLKDEARSEIRAEYRETIRSLQSDKAELKRQVSRLQEGMSGSQKLLAESREEQTLLKARFANLSEEYETLKAERSQ